MAINKKPVPKSQVELSQETVNPYLSQGKGPIPSNLRRENQRSVKGDNVKQFKVGLQDIDEAIVYYFNNVIKPSVIQNSLRVNVPVIYGSAEKWAAVQKDGYYRDNNGKIQLPLIMFKRDTVEKNRTLGNKLDANNPLHFGVFEKKYSPKNFYDRFSALSNRIPVKEYYGVIMPDYVNLTYTCIVFTEYVEQMNSIVESINYASDSYWGDPERFKFRAAIDSYTTTTEHVQGETRSVKTTFQIKLAGYVVPDTINTAVANPNKFYSKAAVTFRMETAGSTEILNAKASTSAAKASTRFFDVPMVSNLPGNGSNNLGMTEEQITYVGLQSTALADSTVRDTATYFNRSIAVPPTGFSAPTEGEFQVYINGILIPVENRSTNQNGVNIEITFKDLRFNLEPSDQIVLIGKFN
ncbi:MAG TPA: hypothetical protein PKC87_01935 [Candidatus Absconditabacterales bacterium]|nr:hypothetical protein [Candidatus Absconditabacterales bacterium]